MVSLSYPTLRVGREMAKSVPGVKVLVLTMHAERERLLPLLQAGARGYLTKEAASRDLVEAIRAEIARHLGISTKTVDAYKRRVQDGLGLEHRTDYVRFALEAGILGP